MRPGHEAGEPGRSPWACSPPKAGKSACWSQSVGKPACLALMADTPGCTRRMYIETGVGRSSCRRFEEETAVLQVIGQGQAVLQAADRDGCCRWHCRHSPRHQPVFQRPQVQRPCRGRLPLTHTPRMNAPARMSRILRRHILVLANFLEHGVLSGLSVDLSGRLKIVAGKKEETGEKTDGRGQHTCDVSR